MALRRSRARHGHARPVPFSSVRLEAAGVVQKLPDRHALSDRTGVAIERERPLVDKLEHDCGNEDLGHARDPETMIRSEPLSCLEIGNAGGSLPMEARTGGQRHGARKVGPNNGVEMIVERLQKRH